MRRLRQMVETITERLRAVDYRERMLVGWQTRSIAQFVAAYGGKEAMAAAGKLSLTDYVPPETAVLERGMNSAEALSGFAAGLARGNG